MKISDITDEVFSLAKEAERRVRPEFDRIDEIAAFAEGTFRILQCS